MGKTNLGLRTNYLCECWQGFLQQIVYQISRGYHFYCITNLPAAKRDKWPKIDEKLRNKYAADKSKDQRYRHKQLGQANFMYLRWEHCALILHTDGQHDVLDDLFVDVRCNSLVLQISTQIGLQIHHGAKGVTVHFTRDTYRGIKAILLDAVRNPKRLISEFDRLNGLPAWGGICEQRGQLLEFALRSAKRAGTQVKREDFRHHTRRKIYPVWSSSDVMPPI